MPFNQRATRKLSFGERLAATFAGGRGGRDRGLLAGGVLLAFLAAFVDSFAIGLPMWIVESDEKDGARCLNGTGLFKVGYSWGNDVGGVPCSNEGRDTSWQVCEPSSPQYSAATCTRLGIARVLLFGSLMLALVAAGTGARGMQTGIKKRLAYLLARLACGFAVSSSLCAVGGWATFWTTDPFKAVDVYGCSSTRSPLLGVLKCTFLGEWRTKSTAPPHLIHKQPCAHPSLHRESQLLPWKVRGVQPSRMVVD